MENTQQSQIQEQQEQTQAYAPLTGIDLSNIPSGTEEDGIEFASDLENMGFTGNDQKSFVRWVMGQAPTPPEVVDKIVTNIKSKISVGLGLGVVANIPRQTRLSDFINSLEADLFDPNKIIDMSTEEKLELWDKASKTLSQIQETQRKFVAQQGDSLLANPNSAQGKIQQRIMALTPEQLVKLSKALDDVEKPEPTNGVAGILDESAKVVTPEVVEEI